MIAEHEAGHARRLSPAITRDTEKGKNMTTDDMRRELERHGYLCGARDPRLNTNHVGAFMVTEADYQDPHYGYELPTEDGANGPWCIVGDDLSSLISEAYDVFRLDWEG